MKPGYRIFFFSLVAVCAASAFGRPLDPLINIAGTGGLRNGDYARTIDTLRRMKNDPDTAFRMFKLGIAYACVGDTTKALRSFQKAIQADSVIAPFAWEAMGDIAFRRSPDKDSAFLYYCRALASGIPDRYRSLIFEKTLAAIGGDTGRISNIPYVTDYRAWVASRAPAGPDSLVTLVDSMVAVRSWTALDSLLAAAAALPGKRLSTVLKAVDRARLPDSALSTATWFALSVAAMEQRLLSIAEKQLAAAMRKKDFSVAISEQRYRYLRGLLSFYQKKYDVAAPQLAAYMSSYGYDPELVLVVARAYWGLDSTANAARWYDRYIEKYPHSKSVPEILWRRAWIEEERNRLPQAIGFYRKLFTVYSKSPRAEESNFRCALCFYQTKTFDSAIAVFSAFEKKFPLSPFAATSAYWRARSLIALDKVDSAKTILARIGRAEPHEYYAHRARYLLRLCDDSVNANVAIDTVVDEERTLGWLDSLSAGRPNLLLQDSVALRRGLALLVIGATDAASWFLDPIEINYSQHLSLHYRLALLYRDVGAFSKAAMTGRRFAWRLPIEARGTIPLSLYLLMYPTFYVADIARQTQEWNVDPCFVWAVIRQESIFNSTVVSPAGAIGLMQIMPGTGKNIARSLKCPFSNDSLFVPAYNIRFGTWYLRSLLDEFSDNKALAAASYNGGPMNAREWYLRNQSEDVDLFVENIGFTETRNYVKKVLANYWTYRKLTRIAPLPKP